MNSDNYYTLLMYFVILSSQYTIDSSSIIFAMHENKWPVKKSNY